MSCARRVAMWVFAAAMAAAPSVAVAAQACSSCCCAPAPCHDSPGSCETTLASMPCGDDDAPAVPTIAKRAAEPPPFQAALPAASRPVADLWSVRTRVSDRNFCVSAEALRLSVVLRL